MSHGCQYVTPDGGIFATAIVEDDDSTGWQIVDVVANRTGFFRIKRSIKNGVRTSRHAKRVITRLDAKALTGDTQLVHRITECCGIQPGRTLYIAVSHEIFISNVEGLTRWLGGTQNRGATRTSEMTATAATAP